MRTVAVTGSSGGIGSALVARLEEIGHRVVCIDIVASTLGSQPSVDLNDWDECIALARGLGEVDVLINNAATLIERPSADITNSDFNSIMAVNLAAPFLLMRELLPGMADRGFGRIVNVASIACRTGGTRVSAVYAASKAGLVSLTKNFAREYASYGVTINAVAPGAIDTPMSRGQMARDNTLMGRLLESLPIKRLGSPTEVVALICFLISDEASFVTGSTIDINGGLFMS